MPMNIFLVWLLFSIFSILLLCHIFCYTELKKYKHKYDHLPKVLMALLTTYPQKFLIENKVLSNYAENKIKNAYSRINFYKRIKIYCDTKIKRELEEIGQ